MKTSFGASRGDRTPVTWAEMKAELNDIAAVVAELSRELPPERVGVLLHLLGQQSRGTAQTTAFAELTLDNMQAGPPR